MAYRVLSNTKSILVKEQLLHNYNKKVSTFLKGMSLKVNIIAGLEFEITNYNVAQKEQKHSYKWCTHT